MRFRTWMKEAAVMALVLSLTTGLTIASTGDKRQILAGVAVFVTFMHAQVSDRLRAYSLGETPAPPECARMERIYYYVKEVLWFFFFASIASWPTLAGTACFLLYPKWRNHVRQ